MPVGKYSTTFPEVFIISDMGDQIRDKKYKTRKEAEREPHGSDLHICTSMLQSRSLNIRHKDEEKSWEDKEGKRKIKRLENLHTDNTDRDHTRHDGIHIREMLDRIRGLILQIYYRSERHSRNQCDQGKESRIEYKRFLSIDIMQGE